MVISSFCSLASSHLSPRLLTFHPEPTLRAPAARPRRSPILRNSRTAVARNTLISNCIQQTAPRSLFPGGYKRPEIKLPNLVLRLSSDDVYKDGKAVIDVIDEAVSDRFGIVVLTDGEGSGKKLYEAACLLKSVIKDRAYLLIDERVDIAAAVNASGVLLSDQGLPTIVARNTLMDAKPDSVILPLVARNVQTHGAAFNASTSEGADFLIYTINRDSCQEELASFVSGPVKIPTFVMIDSLSDGISFELMDSLRSAIDGIVVSVDELNLLSKDNLRKFSFGEIALNKKLEDGTESFDRLDAVYNENGLSGTGKMVAGFTRLEERERKFIEKEKLILLEVIGVIQRATPQMGDISLLKDAVSQLGEPFSLVIVVIVC